MTHFSHADDSLSDAEPFVDWTQLPDGCRLLVVKHMNSATRATWRAVCKLTRQDTHASTHALTWLRSNGDEFPRPLLSQPCPTTLPDALLSSLPSLRHLNCSGMSKLTSIHGVPATLRSLTLAWCHGIDSIAPLQHCKALEELKLTGTYGNSLHVEKLAATLPPFTSAVSPHLRRLTLKLNSVESEAAANSVLQALAPLTLLQELELAMPPATREQWRRLAHTLAQMADLHALSLPDTQYCSDMVPELKPVISRLPRLQRLAACATDRDAATALAEAVAARLPSLTALDFGQASFEEVHIAALVAAFSSQAATLTSVSLSSTYLARLLTPALAASLQGCTALTHLALSNCMFSAGRAATLATLLSGSASTLTTLDISNNYMGDKGAATMAPVLSCMTALSTLDYSGAGLGPEGASALAGSLSSLAPSLTSLDLAYNLLGTDGLAALAPVLRRMTCLTHLNCTDNMLSPASAGLLVSMLPAMPRLRLLGLHNNLLGFEGLRAMCQGLNTIAQGRRWFCEVQFPDSLLAKGAPRSPEDTQEITSAVNSVEGLSGWKVSPLCRYGPDVDAARVLGLWATCEG